jgi:hypothetical protein
VVPIVALITYRPIGGLFDVSGNTGTTDAIVVSLKTNGIAFGPDDRGRVALCLCHRPVELFAAAAS